MPSSEHRTGDMRVAVQAIVSGDQDSRVQAVTADASPTGEPYVSVRVGRVLLYLEDRAALNAFAKAFDRARGYAEAAFGSDDAEFEARERKTFEQSTDRP
ncbi:hypothetical protein [Actinopolymorpha alba]|uniref:hypothetical protein n=1 Tax=Actinopolymorpha alba TaxID=533267 RepID=UPI000377444D|nr:hypothetical protein [Actinopolymorpha alba]